MSAYWKIDPLTGHYLRVDPDDDAEPTHVSDEAGQNEWLDECWFHRNGGCGRCGYCEGNDDE